MVTNYQFFFTFSNKTAIISKKKIKFATLLYIIKK